MSDETNAGIDDPGGEKRPGLPVSARTLRIVSTVLAVVLVLAVAGSVVLALKARSSSDTEKEQAAASAVASQFALRMDKADGTAFDSYIKGINQLLTTKAKTKNTQTFAAMKQSYETAKVKGTGKVLLTGVGTPTTTRPPCSWCTTRPSTPPRATSSTTTAGRSTW